MTSNYLGSDRLYDEIHQELGDMSDYLESDTLRRQANTVVRLTVVTTFGLVGTVVTGFLGMNLIALAEAPFIDKVGYFLLVLVPTTVLTFYTIVKSKRLSDFLEALSDERLPAAAKFKTLLDVWKSDKPSRPSRPPASSERPVVSPTPPERGRVAPMKACRDT